jgi:large subunit ribosomal protein L6
MQGQTLQVRAGFAHEVHKLVPTGLTVTCPSQTSVSIKGIDKQLVGQFAADVRSIRKAEPYLGKGIKYEGEVIRRKESKAAKK